METHKQVHGFATKQVIIKANKLLADWENLLVETDSRYLEDKDLGSALATVVQTMSQVLQTKALMHQISANKDFLKQAQEKKQNVKGVK